MTTHLNLKANSMGAPALKGCLHSEGKRMGWLQRFAAQFGRPTGFWGTVAGTIMAHRRSNIERNAWTISLLDLQPDDRVLEIGTGPGVAMYHASQLAIKGFVAGIDHSETMVRQARRRNATAIRDGRVDVLLGSVSSLPAFNEPFDKIFSINSILFWDNPIECLRALRSALRPGGLMAISMQPRSWKATDERSQEIGRELVANLTSAGCSEVRLETNPMKPVSAVCALGIR